MATNDQIGERTIAGSENGFTTQRKINDTASPLPELHYPAKIKEF